MRRPLISAPARHRPAGAAAPSPAGGPPPDDPPGRRGGGPVPGTRLNPALATWRAPCVHGRHEVTWFRTQLTTADHEDCPCPAPALTPAPAPR